MRTCLKCGETIYKPAEINEDKSWACKCGAKVESKYDKFSKSQPKEGRYYDPLNQYKLDNGLDYYSDY